MLSPSSCNNISSGSPVGHQAATVMQQQQQHSEQHHSSVCSCSRSWFASPNPEVTLSPSPSPSGLLVGGSYDPLDYSYFATDSGCRSSTATSPIAVTGPPLAHAPYGPLPHMSSAAAFSLPPQLLLPQVNQATGNFSPPQFMGKKNLILFYYNLSSKVNTSKVIK
jgi:hypothetical protein